MPLEEILEDLVLKSPEIPLHPTGMEGMTGGGTISDVSPETLVLALEKECNSKYEDPGEGLHFVGVSLTVFAAEIVSAYWERNAEEENSLAIVVRRRCCPVCIQRILWRLCFLTQLKYTSSCPYGN